MRILATALLLACVACDYGASFVDCAIRCSSESGCPSGFTCGTEGLCRTAGIAGTCAAILGDAPNQPRDGTQFEDAPVLDMTLSENASPTVTAGDSPYCSPCSGNACTTGVQHFWYRAFALSDFAGPPWNVASSFHITAIHFAADESTDNANVTIKVWGYSGSVGSATLDTTLLTPALGTATVIVPNGGFDEFATPITTSADIQPNGAFVVEVLGDDTYVLMGPAISTFHLGANSTIGTTPPTNRPSYMKPCTAATSQSQIPASQYQYIVSVEGTYL
jgi:hypothetical protein